MIYKAQCAWQINTETDATFVCVHVSIECCRPSAELLHRLSVCLQKASRLLAAGIWALSLYLLHVAVDISPPTTSPISNFRLCYITIVNSFRLILVCRLWLFAPRLTSLSSFNSPSLSLSYCLIHLFLYLYFLSLAQARSVSYRPSWQELAICSRERVNYYIYLSANKELLQLLVISGILFQLDIAFVHELIAFTSKAIQTVLFCQRHVIAALSLQPSWAGDKYVLMSVGVQHTFGDVLKRALMASALWQYRPFVYLLRGLILTSPHRHRLPATTLVRCIKWYKLLSTAVVTVIVKLSYLFKHVQVTSTVVSPFLQIEGKFVFHNIMV